VCHRCDAGRVDRLQGLDEPEHPIQLPERPPGFVSRQFEPRELRDSSDILGRQRQWETPIFVENLSNYKV
jgi:hypothetical protein